MKKSDLAMIIFIASVSIIVAYFVLNSIPFLQAPTKPVSVKTFNEITSDLEEPDPDVFNKNAINPTVEVFIGNGSQAQSGQ